MTRKQSNCLHHLHSGATPRGLSLLAAVKTVIHTATPKERSEFRDTIMMEEALASGQKKYQPNEGLMKKERNINNSDYEPKFLLLSFEAR